MKNLLIAVLSFVFALSVQAELHVSTAVTSPTDVPGFTTRVTLPSELSASNYVDNAKLASSNYVNSTQLSSGLSSKENSISAGTTSQYWRGDKTWQTLPVALEQEVMFVPIASGQVYTNDSGFPLEVSIPLTITHGGLAGTVEVFLKGGMAANALVTLDAYKRPSFLSLGGTHQQSLRASIPKNGCYALTNGSLTGGSVAFTSDGTNTITVHK